MRVARSRAPRRAPLPYLRRNRARLLRERLRLAVHALAARLFGRHGAGTRHRVPRSAAAHR